MKARLLNYIAYAERRLAENLSLEQAEKFRREMLVQIEFFQHERLVHLLVTLLFALLFVAGILFFSVFPSVAVLLLDLLFLVLLVPYIRHYYVLENGVQKLYALYDKIGGESF